MDSKQNFVLCLKIEEKKQIEENQFDSRWNLAIDRCMKIEEEQIVQFDSRFAIDEQVEDKQQKKQSEEID